MQLESHATPTGISPQQRYAMLHRSIEQGIDSDDMWFELASVSSQLGHHDEAIQCIKRINSSSHRAKAERNLPKRRGITATRSDSGTELQNTDAAPRRKDVDLTKPAKAATDNTPGVIDHLVDAGQYLLHQHMPWLVLTTMLAFPLFVGLGGILTADGYPPLLAAIAALPGISVLIIVAAMGHRILRASSDGDSDVPQLPSFYSLLTEARDFLLGAGLVLTIFFCVPVTLGIADAPFTTMLPMIGIGLFLAPLTFALLLRRRDMRTFSPVFLVRAVRRCGRGYAVIALVIALAFTPAGLVATTVMTYPIAIQVAIIGPLCVMPTFAISRLLGTWLDSHRGSLGYLMQGQMRHASLAARTTTFRSTRPSIQRRRLHRPATRPEFQTPNSTTTCGQADLRPAAPPASASAEKARGPLEPHSSEGRSAPRRQPASTATSESQDTLINDVMIHKAIRGTVVVSGAERARHGAASRRS